MKQNDEQLIAFNYTVEPIKSINQAQSKIIIQFKESDG